MSTASAPARAKPTTKPKTKTAEIDIAVDLDVEADEHPQRIPNIMLIEDNPGDVELTMLGFEVRGLVADFHVAADGLRAIRFLQNVITGSETWRPDLILLDLNMPQVNGHRVLRFIKEHEALSAIPTAILTSSSASPDYVRCSATGADAYLVKPMTLQEMIEMMDRIEPLLDYGR